MPSEETRKKITETAIDLFNSYGCKAVTMDQISSALHISKRTLYETFTSKEELLMECLTEVHHRIGHQKMELFNNVNDPLLLTIYVVKTAVFHNDQYYRFLQDADRYYPQLNKTLLKTFSHKFRSIMRDILEQAKANGDLRENVKIDNVVNVISSSITIWHNQSRGSEEQNHLVEVMHDSIYSYLRGLLSVEAILRYDERENEFKKMIASKSSKSIDNIIIKYNNESEKREKSDDE